MIRREFARQGYLVAFHSGFKKLSRWLKHNRNHFIAAVGQLRAAQNRLDPEDRKAIDELDTFARQIERFGRRDLIIRDICHLTEDKATLATLGRFVNELIEMSSPLVPCDVITLCKEQRLPASSRVREVILGLSLITDELVANSIRHSMPTPHRLMVVIGWERGLEIQVVERGAESQGGEYLLTPDPASWSPYLMSTIKEGEGMKMVRDFANQLGLKVMVWKKDDGTCVYAIRLSAQTLISSNSNERNMA